MPYTAEIRRTNPTCFLFLVDQSSSMLEPMCAALRLAHTTGNGFLRNYPDCYPPLVMNITDGESTDGVPEKDAANLRELASSDGNVLLLNAHVSAKQLRPIEYPDREEGLP